MSLYSIKPNTYSGEFDTQFPAFLQSYGISPQQFIHTLATCNGTVRPKIKAIQTLAWLVVLFIFIMLIMYAIFVGIFAGVVLPSISRREKPLGAYPAIIPIVSLIVSVVIAAALMYFKKKLLSTHTAIKQDLIAFLEDQNRTVYLSFQLQLILKSYSTEYNFLNYFGNRSGTYFGSSVPKIVIISCVAPQIGNITSSSLTISKKADHILSGRESQVQNQNLQVYQPLESSQTHQTQEMYQTYH
jgi:hypothetical protein